MFLRFNVLVIKVICRNETLLAGERQRREARGGGNRVSKYIVQDVVFATDAAALLPVSADLCATLERKPKCKDSFLPTRQIDPE